MMPNMNRAARRKVIELERAGASWGEMLPHIRAENEDWRQFYAHVRAIADFKRGLNGRS